MVAISSGYTYILEGRGSECYNMKIKVNIAVCMSSCILD